MGRADRRSDRCGIRVRGSVPGRTTRRHCDTCHAFRVTVTRDTCHAFTEWLRRRARAAGGRGASRHPLGQTLGVPLRLSRPQLLNLGFAAGNALPRRGRSSAPGAAGPGEPATHKGSDLESGTRDSESLTGLPWPAGGPGVDSPAATEPD